MAGGEVPAAGATIRCRRRCAPSTAGMASRLWRPQRRRRADPLLPPRRPQRSEVARRRSRQATGHDHGRCRPRPGSSCWRSPGSSTARTGTSTTASRTTASVLHLKLGEQGHYHFQSLSAPFAITPGEQGRPLPQRLLVRPDRHEAADQPARGTSRRSSFCRSCNKTGPAEQIGWRLPQAWDYFLRGKAVFDVQLGRPRRACARTRRARKVKGKCAAAVAAELRPLLGHGEEGVGRDRPAAAASATPPAAPGTAWSRRSRRIRRRPTPSSSLMAIKPVSIWDAQHGWTGINPGFRYQMPKPEGEARLADYIKAGWDKAGRPGLSRGL